MESPNEETLRKMTYAELRKYARKSGIKGNKKIDDLIASILRKKTPNNDAFDTIEDKLINSSTKNKEEKFNADKSIGSATPRRETYTIDTPMQEITNSKELVSSSASPEFKNSTVDETNFNITMTRGSEKKLKKHKVSFQTPLRRSERLSLLTPQFASVKGRPKTPIPSRDSSGTRKCSLSNTSYQADESKNWSLLGKISGDGKERRPSTPMPVPKSAGKKQASAEKGITSGKGISFKIETPLPLLKEVDSETNTPRSGLKRSHTPSSIKHDIKVHTPNFSKLHCKEFDKMESLDEYTKRLTATAEKRAKEQERFHIPGEDKKIKKGITVKPFGGIPFIPSAPITKGNFVPSRRKHVDTPKNKSMTSSFLDKSVLSKTCSSAGKAKILQASSIDMPLKKKNVFDLKASLSKKLPYKPHRGPLKPLSEKNLDCTLPLTSTKIQANTKENEVIKANRVQSRAVLKGVRLNRRFELQMKNRKRTSV